MNGERYRIAPVFPVRAAGGPIEVLERLGTPLVNEAARELVAIAAARDDAADAALGQLAAKIPDDRGAREKVWKKLKKRQDISPELLAAQPWLADFDRAQKALAQAESALATTIDREYQRIHDVLLQEGARELPDLLVIQAEDALDRMFVRANEPSTRHNSEDRKSDRTLALYLQRVCAKNDTLSRFGPVGWGRIVPGDGAVFDAALGDYDRTADVEKWVVHSLIAVLNSIPEVRAEVAPRLEPHGWLDGDRFVRLDEERTIELTEGERFLAMRCNGATPAHALGDADTLARLAERGVIRWQLEAMGFDIKPLPNLQADVASWRPSALRDEWQQRLAALADMAERFRTDPSATGRRRIVGEVRALLETVGIAKRETGRALYAATNPIVEDCYLRGSFQVGDKLVDRLVSDAWPWFELWNDVILLACKNVYERLVAMAAEAPRHGGVLRYSTLHGIARRQGVNIETDQYQRKIAAETWERVKVEFTAMLAERADAPTWHLTADDCTFLRRRYELPESMEMIYPSLDLQLASASNEDLAAGRAQWIIAETHYAPIALQNSTYWCSPEKERYTEGMTAVCHGLPFCARDAYGEAPVHTCGERVMDAMPNASYAGAGRPKPEWKYYRPGDLEVVFDAKTCDARLRAPDGTDLGSLIRTVRMQTGPHPFFPFERLGHEPRLMLGDVIVQRQGWRLESKDFGEPRPDGVSPAFVATLERLRAQHGIPRYVYVRASRGTSKDNVWARDKDNKPMFVDLESVVFLDILERRLQKYGALGFVEMLPSPSNMSWRSTGGRVGYEIRTHVLPRQAETSMNSE